MFDRLIALIDESNYNKIKQQKILLVGVGGVGSYALETLVRNGFTNITIIDYDKIDRHLITNNQNIGHSKVIAGILRSKSINPDILIDGIENKLTETNIEEILALNFDYVIDACDDINIKFLLMVKKEQYKYQLISSMGTAKKLDPTKLKITTLDKTTNDPLARILRKKVKDAKIKYKINVVSSDEVPLPIKTLGSANLVPSVAGILCVSYIINDLIKK